MIGISSTLSDQKQDDNFHMYACFQGEPDKKSFGREHHECVFMGKNLYNPGKWWDGVCAWTKWSFDCICKI